MSDNIIAFHEGIRVEVIEGKAVPEIVTMLHEYLELAEKGELIALALVGINADGDKVHRDVYAASRQFTLVGGLSNLLAYVNKCAGFPGE